MTTTTTHASVRFENDKMIIEGGKGNLKRAKSKTNICSIKNVTNCNPVKLVPIDNQ